MPEFRSPWRLIAAPRTEMPRFLLHPDAIHATFNRFVLPWVGLRSLAIFLRSCAVKAYLPGLILALFALLLQLMTWMCFAWTLIACCRLWSIALSERQAFALSTAISLPLWLGGIFYLLPEDPPLTWMLGRLAVVACSGWGVLMLSQVDWPNAPAPPKKQILLAGAAVAYVVIYGLFFVATGLLCWLFLWLLGASTR